MEMISNLLLAVAAVVLQPADSRAGLTGCVRFDTLIAKPIAARGRRMAPSELGGVQTSIHASGRPIHRVGALRLVGGVEISSDDPRFAGLRVSSETGLYHRCGRKLEPRWGAPGNPPVFPVSFVVNRVKGGKPTESGNFEASKTGAMPILDGYRPVSSWPLHAGGGRRYVGLMHPENGKRETVVVEFGEPDANRPTRILATFPYILQRVESLPDLHQPKTYVTLSGREIGGPYRQLTLAIDDPF